MAEDHGAPEAWKFPRAWARGRRETRESPKSERSGESVAGQCRMRGVLGPVSTGAVGRILDSANPKEIRTYKKAVPVVT